MKRFFGIFLLAAVLFSGTVSCSRRARVIPRGKMQQIYQEMLLADQWLNQDEARRQQADTTWFYVPIFEKHGYTVEDYRKSVTYYLRDPERYARLMEQVSKNLLADADRLRQEFETEAQARRSKALFPVQDKVCGKFGEYTPPQDIYERFRMVCNDKGIYVPEAMEADTLFRGPALVPRDSALMSKDASPVSEAPGLVLKRCKL